MGHLLFGAHGPELMMLLVSDSTCTRATPAIMILSQRLRVPGGQKLEMGFLEALYTFECYLIIVYETINGFWWRD